MAFKKYTIEKLSIEDLASDGRGVAKVDGKVIFVPNAIPGDIVEVEVFRKQKKFFEAEITHFEEFSDDRTTPICTHFGTCGGCKLQHVTYEAQTTYKQKQVVDALNRIGGLHDFEILPIITAPDTYHFRNKLEFTFSPHSWLTKEEIATNNEFERRVLGFHVPGFFDKIVGIDTCYLQPEPMNEIRNFIYNFAIQNNITFYENKAHTGFLRTFIIRNSPKTNDWMVVLTFGELRHDWIDLIFNALKEKFPQITSFYYFLNTKLNDSYGDLQPTYWAGKEFLIDKLGEYSFQISPKAFFQTNTIQAENLYQVIYDWIGEKRNLIFDLYSGAGSIGIFISKLANKIIGIEYVEESVIDAKNNCKLNNLNHLDYFAGDMAKLLTNDFLNIHGKPDLIVTDPPRAGMDEKVVKQLLQIQSPEIIYVSCNPATQARDLQLLATHYDLIKIQPIDMFPQTTHVENIAFLKLRK